MSAREGSIKPRPPPLPSLARSLLFSPRAAPPTSSSRAWPVPRPPGHPGRRALQQREAVQPVSRPATMCGRDDRRAAACGVPTCRCWLPKGSHACCAGPRAQAARCRGPGGRCRCRALNCGHDCCAASVHQSVELLGDGGRLPGTLLATQSPLSCGRPAAAAALPGDAWGVWQPWHPILRCCIVT